MTREQKRARKARLRLLAERLRAKRAERKRIAKTIARFYWSKLSEIGVDDGAVLVGLVSSALDVRRPTARNLLVSVGEL